MLKNRSSGVPPEAMTWRKATPILVVALLFDIIRGFFQMFWFFGPAFFAIYCTYKVSGWVSSLWGLTAAACAAGSAMAGAAIVALTAPIGVIMADAVGLIAFLVLGFWIVRSNARLFKTVATGPAYFVGAFAFGEIPFVGVLPVFTLVLWRLYKTQIRVEQAALKKWAAAHAAEQLQARQQQAAELMRVQSAQVAQARTVQAQQEAAQTAVFAEQEAEAVERARMESDAANDDQFNEEEIPRYGT